MPHFPKARCGELPVDDGVVGHAFSGRDAGGREGGKGVGWVETDAPGVMCEILESSTAYCAVYMYSVRRVSSPPFSTERQERAGFEPFGIGKECSRYIARITQTKTRINPPGESRSIPG